MSRVSRSLLWPWQRVLERITIGRSVKDSRIEPSDVQWRNYHGSIIIIIIIIISSYYLSSLFRLW